VPELPAQDGGGVWRDVMIRHGSASARHISPRSLGFSDKITISIYDFVTLLRRRSGDHRSLNPRRISYGVASAERFR
jgi:hypothetical protein